MGEVPLQVAPHAGDMGEVGGLAVARAEPREDADDLGVAPRRQHRAGGVERIRIEGRKGGAVARERAGRHAGAEVAAGILD